MIYINDMQRKQLLFIEQTVSYNGPYAPKIHIFNSECSDSVLLFDIIISTLASCYGKYTVHIITDPGLEQE